MNSKSIFFSLIIIVVIGVGYLATSSNETDSITQPATNSEMAENTEVSELNTNTPAAIVEPETMSESETAMEMEDESMTETTHTATPVTVTSEPIKTVTPDSYLTYSAIAVANSEADHIVLNFSATWCPSCRTLDKDINANLNNIPTGTEIYKVDYDTNVALRQKYGVTTQHTMVLIDSSGNKLKQWSGSNTLDALLAKI